MKGTALGTRRLVRLGAAAMALSLAATADARPGPVARGRDLFVFPRDFNTGIACDGRFGFRADPDFGDGLVARYVFDGSLAVNPSHHPIERVAPAGSSFTQIADGPTPSVAATDRFVIRTHDDLIARFYAICFAAELADLHLSAIHYYRASPGQLRASPAPPLQSGDMAPVPFGRRSLDFLPEPVAGGNIAFDTWPAYHSGSNWLSISPEFGAGLNSIYLFEGPYAPQGRHWKGYYPKLAADLGREGFILLRADLDGKSVLIVLDTRILASRDQMVERAVKIRELEFGRDMKLERIVYYPVNRRGIDDLRLPQAVRAALRRQIGAALESHRRELEAAAREMPDGSKLQDLIASEWTHFADDPNGPGYSDELATIGSTFGELHDFKCTRTAEIFTCLVGVTYLDQGRPKFIQREIQVTRDPAREFRLKSYREPIILTEGPISRK